MKEINSFFEGIKDGIPIFLGYLSVSFAFGIFAVGNGLTVMQSLFISMTNVTSAGQLAAVPIITGGGSLIELAVSQIVINLRYALMSVSLSQKLGKSVGLIDRIVISFVNTDEVFAVASLKGTYVGKNYLYGLILVPYIGWSLGTFIGSVVGDFLPESVISALGIAIYAMFVAIVVPQMKKSFSTLLCVALAVIFSIAFYYLPFFSFIPQGFVVIICAVSASALFAFLKPIKTEESECNEN